MEKAEETAALPEARMNMLQWVSLSPSTIKSAPDSAGIYRFYNTEKKIIYIGKSKHLVRRITSYFQGQKKQSLKTRLLVKEIKSIDYILVKSDHDALLLEDVLIKRFQPRYNILLRDDKTFPYLCLTQEPFGRLISTRNKKTPGMYFGPYTNLMGMHSVRKELTKMFQLRTCTYHLSQKNIQNRRYKVCLSYHLGDCLGPCEGKQSLSSYEESLQQVRSILKGRWGIVRQAIQAQLKKAVASYHFEEAALLKGRLAHMSRLEGRSVVVHSGVEDAEVCTVISEEGEVYVNYMHVEGSKVVLSDTLRVRKKLEEAEEDILVLSLAHVRKRYNMASISKNGVLSNVSAHVWGKALGVEVPKRGAKRKLVEMSMQNARNAYRQARIQRTMPKKREAKVLRQVMRELHLSAVPEHIECFDISNLGGESVVGAMVCFRHGRPDKSSYRYFNTSIKGKANDYAAMKEVVGRRYERLLEEEQSLPQLLVIDGGKGQLNAALSVLKGLKLERKIAVIGLAKRLEEIFLPERSESLLLSRTNDVSLLMQRIRNEAHRFVVSFHRKKRGKKTFSSFLDDIKGIGPLSKGRLLKAYLSEEAMKKASLSEISQHIGKSRAMRVYARLRKETPH